ncbi:hypothetical protein [Niabella ginsengisoli]|uniref:Beta-galactosidase n=1 Tax=Niabella ginsengisoli TaxID=522298 RepID=A0ABS9SKQ3_9BACT|nr:hypothetical protein [Niabella ginsengisoli]MCH5598962.1 hypothetical protein [Niabella ginsengisoli]
MIKFLASALLLTSLGLSAQNYSPASSSLTTEWGQKVTPENAWQQYPRPQMQRSEWQNLNGLWNYSIQKKALQNLRITKEQY